jgi:hypothetical protein
MICGEHGGANMVAEALGCAGEGLVVSSKGPGIFLQGLAVHGKNGTLLPGEPF